MGPSKPTLEVKGQTLQEKVSEECKIYLGILFEKDLRMFSQS
jgi:hypothetical protein